MQFLSIMPHLIEPLYDLSQQDCLNELRQTHRFLCNKVRNQWEKRYRGAIADPDYWGCKIKRIRIELREESTHNFIEIVNQVATLERLIDALKWTSGLGSGLVRIPAKTATYSGNNFTTLPSSNSLVECNTKVAGLRQLFGYVFLRESPSSSIL